jgi:hypothetical protein
MIYLAWIIIATEIFGVLRGLVLGGVAFGRNIKTDQILTMYRNTTLGLIINSIHGLVALIFAILYLYWY